MIEPVPRGDEEFFHRFIPIVDQLRHIPARITCPNGNRYAFAERGARGKWLLVWVPD